MFLFEFFKNTFLLKFSKSLRKKNRKPLSTILYIWSIMTLFYIIWHPGKMLLFSLFSSEPLWDELSNCSMSASLRETLDRTDSEPSSDGFSALTVSSSLTSIYGASSCICSRSIWNISGGRSLSRMVCHFSWTYLEMFFWACIRLLRCLYVDV